jgi:pentatricopeptide repeat protein
MSEEGSCRGPGSRWVAVVVVPALPLLVQVIVTLLAAHCRVAGLNTGLAVVHRMREAGVRPDGHLQLTPTAAGSPCAPSTCSTKC